MKKTDGDAIPGRRRREREGIDLAFYRFVIHSLPVGVLTVNPRMKVTSFNPWAESLTGRSAKEALGRFCGDILQGGMCNIHCPLKTAIDRNEPIVRMETTILTKSGETIPVRMHTAALLDNKGRLIGAVEAFQDISHLKALEREKDNLISMFAHDMKSSLTVIGGFALRLSRKTAGLKEKKRDTYLDVILKETNKLDFLVSDFLEFSRLQAGKLKLHFQATSLEKELMELCEAYHSHALQSDIKLELQNERILPVIEADPDRLRRVFTNLLDNALKFSKKGGTITVSTEETDREVLIHIKDRGRGIDPDDLPFIFDIFHRGKDTSETEGSGVGLAAVKAIVEGHGGRVLVESERGKGSIFTVMLPKSKRPVMQ
ncbi:MAG: PAS domain-containing sensor histidine kinase [Deltaproteobacteria bacterium]|nr:PAS domain-containing sensor histidine kinase [Deltaproteobacteria bacterium]